MLRLWPDVIHIGLFTDYCWLQRTGGPVRSYPVVPSNDQSARSGPNHLLLQTLAFMLDDSAKQLRPGSRIVMTVTDSLAAIVTMPWQDSLSGAAELRRYAQLLFGKVGREVGADWVVRAEFCSYGSTGLAYAMTRDFLLEVEQIVSSRGLRLRRVLPACAAAFHLPSRSQWGGKRLFLMRERERTSGLAFSAHGFEGLDVEPATGETINAMRRVVRRSVAIHGAALNVIQWSSLPDRCAATDALLAEEFPKITPVFLCRESLR